MSRDSLELQESILQLPIHGRVLPHTSCQADYGYVSVYQASKKEPDSTPEEHKEQEKWQEKATTKRCGAWKFGWVACKQILIVQILLALWIGMSLAEALDLLWECLNETDKLSGMKRPCVLLTVIIKPMMFPLFLIIQSMTFPLFFPIAHAAAYWSSHRDQKEEWSSSGVTCVHQKKAHNRKKKGEKKVIDVETYEASTTQVQPCRLLDRSALNLLVSEKWIFESEEWLSAPIINASQFILAKLFERNLQSWHRIPRCLQLSYNELRRGNSFKFCINLKATG